MEDYNVTLKYLLSLKTENEWLEYKENNSDPNLIGEYMSALCNSAILEGQDKAYLIYGISDDKQIVGTKFDFKKAKYKQQELENYIQTLLSPRITFSIHDLNFEDDIRVQIIEIETTNVNLPVKYKDVEYIRVNSTKQKLKDFPEKERKLWKCFESKIFETQIIMSNVAKEDIFDLLDYDTYFNLMNIKHNLNKEYILEKLIEEDFVVYKRGTYNITYLGAIVLAKDLNKFKGIKSRAPRVVVYNGNNKFNTLSDITGNKGYAVAFENLIDYINDKALNKAIDNLCKKYNETSGIQIVKFKNKIQFATNPQNSGVIEAVLNPIKEKVLSRATLETLAIIAYKQPITRLEIEEIRGVNSDYAIDLLAKNSLIEIVGRKDAIGKPLLFGTTDDFLKRFELMDLASLPKYEEILSSLKTINTKEPIDNELFHAEDLSKEKVNEEPQNIEQENMQNVN